jgi:uncharacterized protein (TIGR03435 family)
VQIVIVSQILLNKFASQAKATCVRRRQTRRTAWQWASTGLAYVALLSATTGLSCGQAKPAGGASNAAQTDKRDYRFEVASIHPADPSGRISGRPGPSASGRFTSENTTIVGLAMQAFGAKQSYQIEYKPWMLSTHFSVNATYPDGATRADLPIMIHHLLEDRFGLVSHRETRQMVGYELVVTKFGPKLTRSAPLVSEESAAGGAGIVVKNGEPQFAANASGILMTANGTTLRGHNKTMKDLADALANSLHKPVTDATGLNGEYDYTITFVPEMEMGSGNMVSLTRDSGQDSSPTLVRNDGSASLPLPDALQSQLGLKLQPAKNIPTEVVVLDDAKKEPTEN